MTRRTRIPHCQIQDRDTLRFTRKRIEAHVCICFVALKVYKELERMPMARHQHITKLFDEDYGVT